MQHVIHKKLTLFIKHNLITAYFLFRYFLMLNDRMNGRTVKDIMDERKWRKWADQVLVHTLSPNVYRTKEEALQSFEWFSEVR